MAGPVQCETFPLSDGSVMPAVGLGLFQGYGDADKFREEILSGVSSAIAVGYRHFDTAWLYKHSEEALGEALKQQIGAGVVSRGELFITTKLWSTSHGRDQVVPALRDSLRKLQLDYVDNYIVHSPIAVKAGPNGTLAVDENGKIVLEDDNYNLVDTWKGMEECVQLGLAKSIGISNYNERQVKLTLDNCKIPPSNNQVESHPFFTNTKLVEMCQQNNIVVVAYSPMGKPHRPWATGNDPVVTTHPLLNAIGKKYNKTAAQVALRFQVQRGVAVVPKSSNPGRQRQNIDIFDFTLSDDEINEIFDTCDKFPRLQPFTADGSSIFGLDSKEYPFDDVKQSRL